MEIAAEIYKKISRYPISSSHEKRSKHNIGLNKNWLCILESNLDKRDCSKAINKDLGAVSAACSLILHQCGLKENGFEGFHASGTCEAVKIEVVSFWRSKDINDHYLAPSHPHTVEFPVPKSL